MNAIMQEHSLPFLASAAAALAVAGIVLVALLRALAIVAQRAVEAARQFAAGLSNFVVSLTVGAVCGLGRVMANLVSAAFWFATRPLVRLLDVVRDAAVVRLDAVRAHIGREQELRRLWRQSDYRTWKEFRRAFDDAQEQKSEKPRNQRQPPDAFAEACHLFGLPPDGRFVQTALNAAYRLRMQKAHPDRNGNDDYAAKLNAARDLIRKRKGWK